MRYGNLLHSVKFELLFMFSSMTKNRLAFLHYKDHVPFSNFWETPATYTQLLTFMCQTCNGSG
jgi:hypothetical protein